jgi:hypothetical protein
MQLTGPVTFLFCVLLWGFEKVLGSFTATLRQAQGDNHSERMRVFTIGTAKLFQIVISKAKEQMILNH